MNSAQMWQTAYDLHYGNNNVLAALELYNKLIEQYPGSKESEYAKNQIDIIGRITAAPKRILTQSETQEPPIILTTAPFLEGYLVVETIQIITSECVFGINIFKDILASLSDVFGGRSKTSQKVLRDAKETCLSELRKEAISVGANAVIGVDLDYNEFSGGGKSMLFLVANGTAVKVEKYPYRGREQSAQQSGTGYPPQGVGSPDP